MFGSDSSDEDPSVDRPPLTDRMRKQAENAAKSKKNQNKTPE
jgi:broad specificity phosphatase PhoE